LDEFRKFGLGSNKSKKSDNKGAIQETVDPANIFVIGTNESGISRLCKILRFHLSPLSDDERLLFKTSLADCLFKNIRCLLLLPRHEEQVKQLRATNAEFGSAIGYFMDKSTFTSNATLAEQFKVILRSPPLMELLTAALPWSRYSRDFNLP